MRPYDEVHQSGYLSVEQELKTGMYEGDVGIRIADDGRIWICLNGRALIRFKPYSEKFMEYMRKKLDNGSV